MNAAVRYVDYDIPWEEIHEDGAILNLPDTDGWTPYQSEIMRGPVGLPGITLRVWMRRDLGTRA